MFWSGIRGGGDLWARPLGTHEERADGAHSRHARSVCTPRARTQGAHVGGDTRHPK